MISHLGSPKVGRLLWLELGESTKQTNELDEVSLLEKEQRKLHPSEKQLVMPRRCLLEARSESSRPGLSVWASLSPGGHLAMSGNLLGGHEQRWRCHW